MKNAAEKRKSPRFECQVPIMTKKGTAFDTSQTVDISQGGVGIISERFIPINTKMAVEIALAPESEPVLTVGRVKWVQKIPQSDQFRIGMVFSKVARDINSWK